MQTNNPVSVPNPVTVLKNPGPLVKSIAILIASVLVGTFVFSLVQNDLVFDPLNTVAIWIICFLAAVILQINHTNKLFFINVIAGTFLASFYPFDQALLILIFALTAQKILKVF